jgi:hypothetical protein
MQIDLQLKFLPFRVGSLIAFHQVHTVVHTWLSVVHAVAAHGSYQWFYEVMPHEPGSRFNVAVSSAPCRRQRGYSRCMEGNLLAERTQHTSLLHQLYCVYALAACDMLCLARDEFYCKKTWAPEREVKRACCCFPLGQVLRWKLLIFQQTVDEISGSSALIYVQQRTLCKQMFFFVKKNSIQRNCIPWKAATAALLQCAPFC